MERREFGRRAASGAVGLLLAGAGRAAEDTMREIAEAYVKLVLALGQHDADYVDAYYGPAEWKAEALRSKRAPQAIRADAIALRQRVAAQPAPDEFARLRRAYLDRQLAALVARAEFLGGARLGFDAESRAFYDAVAPTHTEAELDAALRELEAVIPRGDGPLAERYSSFSARYRVPREKQDAVFQAALAEARRRTAQHLALPPGEAFRLEYVTGKSWSGYNWYQGGYRSLIQMNVELPITIDRAVDLAAHEGYPGHHVYNALLEHHLVNGRGCVEMTVYPLFSPQSLIAEGTANYGVEVCFPGAEKEAFEAEVLFGLAGLDPKSAPAWHAAQRAMRTLAYAGNEAARRYLEGRLDADAAARFLETYTLAAPERAKQRVRFFDQYRSYVINYNLGQDLVRAWVEKTAGPDPTRERRWQVFASLLASQRLPADLA